MLERSGQRGEKRDSERQGLSQKDRASGDRKLSTETDTEVDRDTGQEKANDSGELGHSDLVPKTVQWGKI